MNNHQKTIISVTAALVAIVLVLHSPWSEYEDMGYQWPISMLRTNAPLIYWFGSFVNFAAVTALIIGVAGLWVFLYRTPKSPEPPADQPPTP